MPPLQVSLPEDLAQEVRELVEAGAYASAPEAVADLVRLGLAARHRGPGGGGPSPAMPPPPGPGPGLPPDVNWAP